LEYLHDNFKKTLTSIAKEKAVSDDAKKQLETAASEFKKSFISSE
jgi:hypothetical protein